MPSSLDLSSLSEEVITRVAFACLHASYHPPSDALARLPAEKRITFQPSWLGEFSPKVSDLVPYGSHVLRGRINTKEPNLEAVLLKQAKEHRERYGKASLMPVTNPLDVLPPLHPPPLHIPNQYAAYDDDQIFIPTADNQLKQWTAGK